MNAIDKKWVYLFVLSIIWGTSYILIKKGLIGLTPVQLGAIRIVFSTFFLFLIGFKSLFAITKKQWPWVALSALCGTFIPVFLFAYAETEIESSIVSILNSLVPLFTIIMGYFIFKVTFTIKQVLGVVLGLIGAGILILHGAKINPNQNYFFAGLVILATICYAANANIIKSKLQEVSPKGIAVGNFAVMILPAIALLFITGVFNEENFAQSQFIEALMYVAVLSVFGTGLAKILFNKLIQISSAVFSTSVTYLIPVVGIFWGILDGETFSWVQGLASGIILIGVYLVNAERRRISQKNKAIL